MTLSPETIAALNVEVEAVVRESVRLHHRYHSLKMILGDEFVKPSLVDDDEDDRPGEQPAATFTAADAKQHETEQASKKKRASKLRASLSPDDIEEIRRAHASGEASYSALGAKFRVSRSTAENVVKRKGAYA